MRALRGWAISATMMPLAYHDSRSATDSLLQMFRVPGSLHRDLGDGVFDRRHRVAFASKPTAALLLPSLWYSRYGLLVFYGICRKNKEPTSGLEPLAKPRYG